MDVLQQPVVNKASLRAGSSSLKAKQTFRLNHAAIRKLDVQQRAPFKHVK